MAAHRLGITRETACQIGGLRSHVAHAAALSAMRTSGCRSITPARMLGPAAPVGTNRRSFHEMISEIRPIAFNRSTMPSVKPESSMRNSPITLTRRSSSPSCKLQDRASVEHGSEGVVWAERRRLAVDGLRDPGRRDQATDDALAIVGLQPVDAHGLVRQPLPDRQQQAGDDVELAVGELRHCGDLGLPGAGEVGPIGFLPMRVRQIAERNRRTLHRPEQADAPFDRAVIEHQARRRHLHGGASGLTVDEKPGTRIVGTLERLVERQWAIAIAAGDGEHSRLGAALRMDVERAPIV